MRSPAIAGNLDATCDGIWSDSRSLMRKRFSRGGR